MLQNPTELKIICQNSVCRTVSASKWNEIETLVRSAILDALNSTTEGYTMDQFIAILSKPSVNLPNEFKDGLKKWDDLTSYDQIPQTRVVLIVVEKLLNYGEIQIKSEFGRPDLYCMAIQTG